MSAVVGAGDPPDASATWGISGPAFLGIFWALVAVTLAATLLIKRSTLSGSDLLPRDSVLSELSPSEIGLLVGRRNAVLAAVTRLHAGGLINAGGQPARDTNPADRLDPISQELARALEHPQGMRTLEGLQTRLRSPIDAAERRLQREGLMPDDRQRTAVRRSTWPLIAVTLLGFVRLVIGLSNGRPVGYLVVSLIATGVLAAVCAQTPRLTRRGRQAVASLRSTYDYLSPRNSPSYVTYGMEAAVLSTALFGAAAVGLYSPELAQADLLRVSSGSGSTDSGGSGCGSGCGGGGCGG